MLYIILIKYDGKVTLYEKAYVMCFVSMLTLMPKDKLNNLFNIC